MNHDATRTAQLPPPAQNGHTPATVLIADDERLVRWSLRQRLEQEGYRVLEAACASAALDQFAQGVDAVLLDMVLPDGDGMDVLVRMREVDPLPPVIMLTAHSSVERAVEAMQRGAAYFLSKPFDLDDVVARIQRATEPYRLRQEVNRLLGQSGGAAMEIVGESRAVRRMREMIRRIARSPASTVLITGESGTGKDVTARAIHAASGRAGGPFLNITCSALPEALLESELFGHERGAFTDAKQAKVGLLEQAHGGTVFLDEIAEMTPTLQAKLLRFLEEKAFRRVGGNVDVRADVRIVAATHRDLAGAIEQGSFRSDLYYRLAVLQLHVPPLREREGDVQLLAKYFLDRFNREFHKRIAGFSPEALQMLEGYAWPGNVRELKNAVERAVLLSDGPLLAAAEFERLTAAREDGARVRLPPGGVDIALVERDLIVQALERTRGNRSRAARLLGLTRDQIRYRIAKFGLEAPHDGRPDGASAHAEPPPVGAS